jgi:hypothetical protein
MAVKAYIIEIPDKKDGKSDEIKNKKSSKRSSNISEGMKFIVPGCKTGEGCNNCGNCH